MLDSMSITDMEKVGMGDLKLAFSPKGIITLGLGSCVGVTMYDPVLKLGGMLHAMLPDSSRAVPGSNAFKFVDTGVTALANGMQENGAIMSRVQVKLVGGASMFPNLNNTTSEVLQIGENNVKAAKEVLRKLGLRIIAEETGQNFGRTIVLNTENGNLEIRSIGKENRNI